MAKKELGAKEYNPTRLEWLAVMVNSVLPRVNDEKFHAYCLAAKDGKSIIINIKHDRRAPEELINKLETDIKELVLAGAQMYEWDSWLKIQTVISVKD